MSHYKSDTFTISAQEYETLLNCMVGYVGEILETLDNRIDTLEATDPLPEVEKENLAFAYADREYFQKELEYYEKREGELYAEKKTFRVCEYVSQEYLGDVEIYDNIKPRMEIMLNGVIYTALNRKDYDLIVLEI